MVSAVVEAVSVLSHPCACKKVLTLQWEKFLAWRCNATAHMKLFTSCHLMHKMATHMNVAVHSYAGFHIQQGGASYGK
jgi:hypothetical protein